MDLPESRAGGPAAQSYPWEQPEELSPGMLLSLEEQILNSTFEACDPQSTGTVAVAHVLAYLEAVTGRGPQDERLQTLAQSLDPSGEGSGATVDLDTFLVVMRDWIAACQLHGGLELEEGPASEGVLTSQQLPSGLEAEEPANLESFGGEDPRAELYLPSLSPSCPSPAPSYPRGGVGGGKESVLFPSPLEPVAPSTAPTWAWGRRQGLWAVTRPLPRRRRPATADLLSSLEDLELSNRRLAGENAKLQRSVETAEEGSARLGEEILVLRRQLRSTQQALQCAKAVDEELEDLKTLAKSLEEQNRRLLAQARQTEKEQQHLAAEVETLQEENGKLLAERDGVKRRSEELATEKDALKRQLYECERLICQRDAVLSERTSHAESLAKTLEEYRTTTQELRLEISHLEQQLSQSHEAEGPDDLLPGAQGRGLDWTAPLPPSLGLEIEAIQQKQEAAAADLCSPLCGVRPWEEAMSWMEEDAGFPPEAPPGDPRSRRGEPVSSGEGPQEPAVWLPRSEEEEEAVESRVTAAAPVSGDFPGSPAESSPAEPGLQQALVPVIKELVPDRRQPRGQLCLRPQQLRVARHPRVPAPAVGLLLLLLLSVLLLVQSPAPTWPHLQLCYLQPPPV
ncbi:protein KASH5 isoform X3 [Oryctolagus cuniculus]|uniref:protein KASH5 isoform X3 n=1 Tax=Oryctolagus cuniculus TaxID=9986 RepID=UPI00222F1031|nr:protein KASH5 isoform X3 [Oryctolagus cuniculus]